jgi:LPS sulfotransferase NodH
MLLRRRDRIGQAISLAIAQQTRQWLSRGRATDAPVYSRSFIERQLADVKDCYDNWDRYFAAEAIEPLTLWYEDIAPDLHAAISTIARFVGGDALEAEVRRSPPFVAGQFDHGFKVQRTGLNEEWRQRFEEGH